MHHLPKVLLKIKHQEQLCPIVLELVQHFALEMVWASAEISIRAKTLLPIPSAEKVWSVVVVVA